MDNEYSAVMKKFVCEGSIIDKSNHLNLSMIDQNNFTDACQLHEQ